MASPGCQWYPQDTAGVLRTPRIPRTPIVSSGYRGILRIPPASCDTTVLMTPRYPQDTVSPGCPLCPRTPTRVYRWPAPIVQRWLLLKRFNERLEGLLPLAHTAWSAQPHTLGARLCALRELVFSDLKRRVWQRSLPAAPTPHHRCRCRHCSSLSSSSSLSLSLLLSSWLWL